MWLFGRFGSILLIFMSQNQESRAFDRMTTSLLDDLVTEKYVGYMSNTLIGFGENK